MRPLCTAEALPAKLPLSPLKAAPLPARVAEPPSPGPFNPVVVRAGRVGESWAALWTMVMALGPMFATLGFFIFAIFDHTI